MTVRFGTDGIRGLAGTDPITLGVARSVGSAAFELARALGGRRVVVGRDTRPSGMELAAAVGEGVVAAGGLWLDAGIVPTPAAALAVRGGLADAGVVVTASHNPAEDNGFKIIGAEGHKLDDAGTAAVEAWIAAKPRRAEGGTRQEGTSAVLDLWRRQLREANPDVGELAGRRIAIDLANGAAQVALRWLTEWIPAELVVLGASGVINDGCGSEHPEALAKAVVEHGCDAGLALDGDADRCRLVDARGHVVPGDAVLWVLARNRRARAMAVTVMSNGALERSLPDVRIVRTQVGDRHIQAMLTAERLDMGGEESGHILFSDHPVGDGLLAGIRTLVAGMRGGKVLSEELSGFVPLPRATKSIQIRERVPLDSIPGLAETIAGAEAGLGEFGRVFLRYSGTEPKLRVLVEGAEGAAVDEALDAVVSEARAALE